MADNKFSYTKALTIASYLTSGMNSTYNTSRQTIVSALTSYAADAQLTQYFVASDNPDALIAASGNVGTIYVSPRIRIDFINFYVTVNNVTSLWASLDLANGTLDFATNTLYSNASAGWIGAGVYTFRAEARNAATGLFDIVSNAIVLTVP